MQAVEFNCIVKTAQVNRKACSLHKVPIKTDCLVSVKSHKRLWAPAKQTASLVSLGFCKVPLNFFQCSLQFETVAGAWL